jgi:hypothetical protein
MATKRSRSRIDTVGGSYKRKKRALVDEEAHSVVGPAQSFSDLSPRLRSVGILTSGGDSQGMNAAVRAAARFAMFKGCHVFGVKEVAPTNCLVDCPSICLSVSLSWHLYSIRDLISINRDTMAW